MNLRARLPSLLPWIWALILAVALTWPAALYPHQQALGSAQADGMKHLWTLWWMRASVWEEGRLPFHTLLINYPVGMDLYPIEPLNGLFAVLLPWMPVVLLANLLILTNLVLTGGIGAWAGRELSGSWRGGLVAGTLLEGSAVMAFFVHVGVGELLHLWWLPLGLGLWLRARRTLRWGWFLWLAVALVGALLSCFYLGFFLAISVALLSLLTLYAGRRTPGLLLRYALAAGLSLAVVLPVTRAFATSYKSGSVPQVGLWSYLTEEHGQPITDPASARLEPAQLISRGRAAARREEGAYGGGRYLGWLALGLAAVGLVRRPRAGIPLLLLALLGAILATGSFLTQGGTEVVLAGGARVRMPIYFLNRLLGYVAEPLNFPTRALAITVTALSGLAALGASGERRWEWGLVLLAPLAVLDIQQGGLLGWPWARFTPREASALEVLREGPHEAVVDVALDVRSDMENRWSALATHIAHGKPTQSVPIERIEYFARDGWHFVHSLALMAYVDALYAGGPAPHPGDYRGDLTILRDAGFGWMVVSYRTGDERIPPAMVAGMSGIFGDPVATGPGLAAWRIPDVEATDEERAAWREAHRASITHSVLTTPGMGPPR